MTRLFVVDTGYLLELLRVPDHFDEGRAALIKQRWREETDRGGVFYVPVSVIFELGNHVAQIKNFSDRRRIAKQVCESLRSSLTDRRPWVVVPAATEALLEELAQLLNRFERDIPESKPLSLTDHQVRAEAERLRRKYNATGEYLVHIWTTDQPLKAHEPDAESAAIV